MNKSMLVLVLCACGEGVVPASVSLEPDVEPRCTLLLGVDAFRQGEIRPTGLPTDLAIDGAGYFVVSDGSVTGYTRDGHFHLTEDRAFENDEGFRLQGFEPGWEKMAELRLPPAKLPVNPTTQISLKVNLDATSTIQLRFDPLNPVITSNFSTGLTLITAQDKAITGSVYWSKTASNVWDFNMVIDGAGCRGGTPGEGVVIANGALLFSNTGALESWTQTSNFVPSEGEVRAQPLDFNFGSGLEGVTQLAAPSRTQWVSADGKHSSYLRTFAFDRDGRLSGERVDGGWVTFATVWLAYFPAPAALRRVSPLMLSAPPAAGVPELALPGPSTGLVVPASLETLPRSRERCVD